jgi:hypothetical protein
MSETLKLVIQPSSRVFDQGGNTLNLANSHRHNPERHPARGISRRIVSASIHQHSAVTTGRGAGATAQ